MVLLPAVAQEAAPATPEPPAAEPAPAPPLTPVPGTPTTPPAAPTPTPGTIPVRLTAERVFVNQELGLVQFFGNATLDSAQIHIRADEISYSTRTDVALARGNVSIQTQDGNTYQGNLLEYQVQTRQWRFIDVTTQYPPEFLGPPFIAPVFVNSQELSGLPNFLRARNSTVTTCNLPDPHYELVSERVEIYPGDKLIAYNSDVYVLGRRVLRLPWFFLSLKQRRSPIVPDAGWNDFEGYYLRLLYQYVLNPNQLGGLRTDLTSKLGIGVGIDHFYTLGKGSGEAFLYGRRGLQEYVARVEHAQPLWAGIQLNLHVDRRQDSLFTFQPTTLTNINTRLTRNTPHSNTLFNYSLQLNEGQFSSDNTTANLRYSSNTAGGSLQVSEEYSSFGQSSGGSPNKDAWNRLNWVRRLNLGDLHLRIDDHMDLDDNPQTSFVGLQRLPEVYLETNQTKLHWDFLRSVPSRFTLGWGAFEERPTEPKLGRYLFDWQATPRPIQRGKTTITLNTNFRQTIYGDQEKTALYSYRAWLEARRSFGRLTNVATYRMQDSRGFTPFNFDFIYPYQTVTDSLQYLTPRLNLFLNGGRDLQQRRWQDLTFRAYAQVSSNVFMTQAIAYDLNNKDWRDLVSQYSWQNNPRVIFNLGSRIDVQEKQLRRVSTELRWVITPMWRLEWLGGYDGISHQYLYNEFLITRDLHCWDASLYVSEQRKYVYLFVRLKALNIPLPDFGIGRGGQRLDTSQGIPF
ncbi:MAG: LPS-assembly protein LptD [Armatimonadota bacterium]